jgi:putative transposase
MIIGVNLIIRCFRYELSPNNKVRTLLRKHADAARFAWNWGLADRKLLYQKNTGQKRYTSAIQQHRKLNSMKKTNFPWLYEVSKCAPQEALRDLEQAMKNFINSINKKFKTQRFGFPKYKKKGKSTDSFRLTGRIKIIPEENKVQLPRLGQIKVKGKIKLPEGSEILSATIKRETMEKWFLIFKIRIPAPEPDSHKWKQSAIGVDLGLKQFAVLSDGSSVSFSLPLTNSLKKYGQLSKSLSRKKKGSQNWQKAKTKLAKHHYKLKNIRKDFLHKLTSFLTDNYGQIIIEDLNVKGLSRNRKLSRLFQDSSLGNYRKMLTYKSRQKGCSLIIADRFYPSSKRCSSCGSIRKDLSLKDRIFKCPKCGLFLDRDHNAAINLLDYLTVAVSSTETINACGDTVRPVDAISLENKEILKSQASSMNQEQSI